MLSNIELQHFKTSISANEAEAKYLSKREQHERRLFDVAKDIFVAIISNSGNDFEKSSDKLEKIAEASVSAADKFLNTLNKQHGL